jgi:protein-disulfide isomerase/uncharacterized membrane protein
LAFPLLTQQTILNTLKNNFLDTFTKFLKQLKVPVTETSALEYLETHADEGSMLAYADALHHFKIENAAIRIKQEDLITLPTPFIAFSQIHGGTFSVVKNLTDSTIEWFDTQKGWVNDKLEEFTKTWSGVVLLAETDEKSGEKNYTQKRREEILRNIRIPIAIGLLVFVLLFFVSQAPFAGLDIYALLALKATGMVVSTLLFIKSIDNANSLVNKLCNAGSKISCQSILDSPAAKITPWLSWSDAGFIYFFGSFLALLFSLSHPEAINTYWAIQLGFSSLSILFSSYSLYYQGIKAKMWCTLCLAVVSIFFLEAALTLSTFTPSPIAFDLQGLVNIAAGFILPCIFLLLYKTTAIKAQESKSLKKELTKLKSNPQIFEALMAGQKQMPEIPADMPVITIGNKNAEHTITMVSNPLCTPCASMHARIEQMLQENENLKCQIIFVSSTKEHNAGGKFVRKLFSLPQNLQSEALHLWFDRNDKNFEKWNRNFETYVIQKETHKIQDYHNFWANTAEIKGTPTIFYDNRLLPEMVKLEDLSHFIAQRPSILN